MARMKNTAINIAKNIGVIVLSIVIFILGEIAQGLCEDRLSEYYLRLIIPSILRIAATTVLAWFVSSRLLKIDARELGLKIGRVDPALLTASVALPVLVLGFYAFVLPGKAYIAKPGEFAKSLITALFRVGITAGICEELIFRGMIFRYMKKTLGVKAAIIVPAVLFACVHISNMETYDPVDLILLVLAGSSVAVMFTVFALASGSICPGAFAHALWNTLIIGGLFGIGEIVNGTGNDSCVVIPVESSSKLLTGGHFGVEAAVPAIIGYISVSLFIVWVRRKTKRSNDV